MNKTSVIIKREYMTRVRKKSFIIMTLLAPVLMAAMFVLPTLLMMNQDKQFKKIAVVGDGSVIFRNAITNTKDAEYVYLDNVNVNDLKKNFEQAGYYGILYIAPELATTPNAIQLFSKKQPPIDLLEHIEGSLEKEIERQKLLGYNIKDLDDILKSIRTKVSVQTIKIDDSGKATETSTGIAMAVAYLGGFLMYMLVFMFGSQVMRGVIEEKTSRVVEVIVSSVKPVQLMMGKILGIALVGLTQFFIWIFLTGAIVVVVKTVVLDKANVTQVTQMIPQSVLNGDQSQAATPGASVNAVQANPQLAEFSKMFDNAMNQNWLLIISSFIFYFITGYLLYASVFAAIGSAVDSETDTQQFMLPVTIPIMLGLFVAIGTMQNPESSISFWFSMIPLTSPIVMMARIPFGVPGWQIALSMVLMVITFLAFVWMAAKIYRTGILMYGKKSSWKEMWKWLRYNG
ncbi:MAG TPA: ABC transporter permease [Bacteroidales bacterium]|nr:ABC transporter permease [Bacteroidales bacterium]